MQHDHIQKKGFDLLTRPQGLRVCVWSEYMSRNMRFPTMWYLRSAKASDQPAHMRSLIRAFASRLHILIVLGY